MTTYKAYVEWDDARRARFPNAKHWIYQSRIGECKVAEWNIYGGGHIDARA